jgi:hypothetical protein
MKYRLRWKLPGRDQPFTETFASLPELDSFRSELVTAQNRGEPFDLDTGLPISMLPKEADDEEMPRTSFLAFTKEYAGMEWPDVSVKSHETIAQTLLALAVVVVEDTPQRPNGNALWRVLSTYAFVLSLWPDDERPERVPRSPSPYGGGTELPSDQRKALALTSLADAKTARRVLDKLKVTQDGSKAAESYFRRRRGVLVNLIGYAIESGELDANPLAKLNEKAPKKSGPIDKSVVFNPAQAADVLAAISYVGSYRRARGRRLVVLFAMLFYAMLRPEEALFVHETTTAHFPKIRAPGAPSGSRRRGRRQGADGPTLDASTTSEGSKRALRPTCVSCLSLRCWSPSSARTSRSSAPPRTGASSRTNAAASRWPLHTHACGARRGPWPSLRRNWPAGSLRTPTTTGTRASR